MMRKIGIWYKERQWAENLFEDFLTYYTSVDTVLQAFRAKFGKMYITLKEDTIIEFISATAENRGCCFSELYIQTGIDKENYCTIILPTNKMYPKTEPKVIRGFSDFLNGYILAKDYYKDSIL